jgi:phosphomannomutase/phosphoglucomutase
MSEHAAVKECDIRGPWPDEVDATFFEQAGRNFGATVAGGGFAGFHPATVVVGGDGRASTPALRAALLAGLLAEGVDVFDVVGATPTPALYWIRQVLAAQAVAIVTASHSPPHWNGLKVMNGPLPPTPADVEALDVAPPPRREAGRRHAIGSIHDTYVAARIAPFAAAGLPGVKIVVDPGGGCQSGVASRAFRELGANVDALHDELDPTFRQRHPDCAVPKHLTELAARVPAVGAAMGIAFDGDGDRLAVIDDRGRYVPAEKVAMLLVDGPLAVRPGEVVVLDIKASMQLERAVARRGGIPVRMKSGHAYMKRAVIERGAVLGSEVSGHLFFGALGGIDDPLFAALTLARWQAAGDVPLSARVDAQPAFHLSPDLRLRISADETDALIDSLPGRFADAEVQRVDGVRLVWPEGWLLARRSITDAVCTLRFEGADATALDAIKARFVAAYPALRPAVEAEAAKF